MHSTRGRCGQRRRRGRKDLRKKKSRPGRRKLVSLTLPSITHFSLLPLHIQACCTFVDGPLRLVLHLHYQLLTLLILGFCVHANEKWLERMRKYTQKVRDEAKQNKRALEKLTSSHEAAQKDLQWLTAELELAQKAITEHLAKLARESLAIEKDRKTV